MMRNLFGLSLLVLVALAGCTKEPPPPPEKEPPPPKTAGEITQEYRAALQPLFDAAAPGAPFGVGEKSPIISQFNTVRSQNREELAEPEAKSSVEKDVIKYLQNAKKAEQWFAVDGLLDMYKVLRPESQVYDSLRRHSDLMMARPIVKCTGFVSIGSEDLQAFLEITDPLTKEVETVRIREGEEFYPNAEGKSILKMIKIIGAQSAIEMEYLALPGEVWEVPGPKNN